MTVLNDDPKSSQWESKASSVSVQARIVQEVTLSDAGTNKDRRGLTFHLVRDPKSGTHLNPMYVLTHQQAHDLHVRLAHACPCCAS